MYSWCFISWLFSTDCYWWWYLELFAFSLQSFSNPWSLMITRFCYFFLKDCFWSHGALVDKHFGTLIQFYAFLQGPPRFFLKAHLKYLIKISPNFCWMSDDTSKRITLQKIFLNPVQKRPSGRIPSMKLSRGIHKIKIWVNTILSYPLLA